MTAPTEPLKLTLEELLERVWEQGDVLYREPGLPGWIHRVDNEKRIKVTPCATWERAGTVALGRPVVARDDAAELRAALRDPYGNLKVLVNLWTEIGYIPNRKDNVHAPLEELQDVLAGFRAALAATEGES